MKQNQKKPKVKQFEIFLQQIPDFEGFKKENWNLEQHMTPPSIAAQLISSILDQQESLEGMIAADFGCGTGMLSAGMICAGVDEVVGYEIDSLVAAMTKQTISQVHNDDQFDIVVTNLKQHKFARDKAVDIIIMNPPFGTKDEPDPIEGGIDSVFLRKAFNFCSGSVYSLHKSSTRDYLKKFAELHGRKFDLVQEIKFPLPKKFLKYHKKEMAYTQVDFIHFLPA